MATTNGGARGRTTTKKNTTGAARSRSNSGGAKSSRSTSSRSTGSQASTRELAGGYAGGFIEAVKARPLTTAALAAGAAGASAFLWAKRAQLADQVSELRDTVREQFASDESTELDSATGFQTSPASGKKGRKASSTDPMMAEQSEVGAISY